MGIFQGFLIFLVSDIRQRLELYELNPPTSSFFLGQFPLLNHRVTEFFGLEGTLKVM